MVKKWLVRSLHMFISGLAEKLTRVSGDRLLHAMDTGHMNIIHTLTDPKLELDTTMIRAINNHFLALRDNLSDEGGNETYPLFIRAYSSWRSAVRSWASGALPETFTLLRTSIENAAQGSMLRLGDAELFERWINRHVNTTHRNEFTFKKALPSMESNYAELMRFLYEICIDRGAHPNPLGTLTGIRESELGAVQVAYQGATEFEMIEVSDFLKLAGVTILQVFKPCYLDCYRAVDIELSLNCLTRDVVDICEQRNVLREEATGEVENIGWISIIREDGVWATVDQIH